MFPNARLVIVAIFSSIVAVSCGLGVFAAFRINHQPFTRLQSADPPLQLVSGSGAPALVKDMAAAPFGVRFPLNAPVAVPEAAAIAPLERTSTTESDPVTAPADPAVAAATAQNAEGGDEVSLSSPRDQASPPMPAEQSGAVAPDDAAPTAGEAGTTPDRKAAAKAVAKRSRRGTQRRVAGVWRGRRMPPVGAPFPSQYFTPAPAASARLIPVPPGTPPVVRRRVAGKPHRARGKTSASVAAASPAVATDPAPATGRR